MTKDKKQYIPIVIVLILCAVFLCGSLFIYKFFFAKPIGTIEGPEFDRITIDGVVYEEDYSHDYNAGDKKAYLGKVETKDSQVTFRVYSVEGTKEYVYTLSFYDGRFYKRVEQ